MMLIGFVRDFDAQAAIEPPEQDGISYCGDCATFEAPPDGDYGLCMKRTDWNGRDIFWCRRQDECWYW